ncbi:hypothetical protein H074_06432 [Amycolatopsis decaplanina DSM 44594]|uniref:Uncharacterized protein n=1 Tax=Amycolatopsis decaplanina DSM 44594 TaxID=1284240 RepID=M2Z8B1_9PSEU|nr:hypothetical protein H074_06432 [Amycolatopsis decaplanina DSM 44594]
MLSWLPQLEPSGEQAEEDFLARLAAFPEFFAALADRHRAGVTAGRTPVERAVRGAVDHVDRFLAAEPNPLLVPPLTGDRVARRERLFTEKVRPALVAYREVLAHEIAGRGVSAARHGSSSTPDCTRWAGAGSAAWTTSPNSVCSATSRCSPRSTGTSNGPVRRCRT